MGWEQGQPLRQIFRHEPLTHAVTLGPRAQALARQAAGTLLRPGGAPGLQRSGMRGGRLPGGRPAPGAQPALEVAAGQRLGGRKQALCGGPGRCIGVHICWLLRFPALGAGASQVGPVLPSDSLQHSI